MPLGLSFKGSVWEIDNLEFSSSKVQLNHSSPSIFNVAIWFFATIESLPNVIFLKLWGKSTVSICFAVTWPVESIVTVSNWRVPSELSSS
jgi:hypothetical protein